jgi:hypothetical protein
LTSEKESSILLPTIQKEKGSAKGGCAFGAKIQKMFLPELKIVTDKS